MPTEAANRTGLNAGRPARLPRPGYPGRLRYKRRIGAWGWDLLATALVILLASAVPIGGRADAAVAAPQIVGEAFLAGSQQLVYREYFYRNSSGAIDRVVYKQPDGTLLAEKLLSFNAEPSQPSFRQQNYLTGRITAVEFSPAAATNRSLPGGSGKGGSELGAGSVAMYFQQGRKQRRVVTGIDAEQKLVIDAGFDPFIRSNWSSLQNGFEHAIQFPLPASGRLLDMLLLRVKCSPAQAGATCFRIRLKSKLLNLFIEDPVYLVYERSSRRLLTYRGVGNVALADGELPRVEINYQYPEPQYSRVRLPAAASVPRHSLL